MKIKIKQPSVLLLLVACSCYSNEICGHKPISLSHLDVAVEMIMKARENFPLCDNCKLMHKPIDCADILRLGHKKSGVYKISPINRLTEGKSINVYCDMKTNGGGWTILQRRGDFKRAKDYFYKDWKSYKEGFGGVSKDFWLGNDNIFALTNQRLYSARFDLQDVENSTRYAEYDTFWIDDESNKYMLHISDYSGDAGDSMIREQNNQKFTTKDQDNDHSEQNCAQQFKGAWWYDKCHQSNLNGQYFNGKHESFADGVNWFTWKGYHESLFSTEIKVRPKNFRVPDSTAIPDPSSTSAAAVILQRSAASSSTYTPMKKK